MTDYETRTLTFRGHEFKIACLNRMEQDPSWFSFDDESSVRDRDWDIKPGDVVFDIGSAYGSYALTALACGAERAWCFNPNGEENEALLASARENGWESRCTIYQGGLWSERGFLRDTDQDFVLERVYELIPDNSHFFVRSLDGLFDSQVDRLDWMKLDVEGAEVEVLKGAEQTIRRFKPRILVEEHLFKDGSLHERVSNLLESYGYRCVRSSPYHAVAHSLYEPAEAP